MILTVMYILCIVDHNLRKLPINLLLARKHALVIAWFIQESSMNFFLPTRKSTEFTWKQQQPCRNFERSFLLIRKRPEFFKVYNLRGSDKNLA